MALLIPSPFYSKSCYIIGIYVGRVRSDHKKTSPLCFQNDSMSHFCSLCCCIQLALLIAGDSISSDMCLGISGLKARVCVSNGATSTWCWYLVNLEPVPLDPVILRHMSDACNRTLGEKWSNYATVRQYHG